MDASEFEALGLYDPTYEHAALQLELLEYLVGLGATAEELVASRDGLSGLAAVLTIRGGEALTLRQVAERADLTLDEVGRVVRVAGFAEPDPDVPVFTEGFIGVAAGIRIAAAVFGEDAALQLLRVLGTSMARVADALVSAFLVNIEPLARQSDPVGLGVAKANADSIALLPIIPPAVDVLLRQHLLGAQRLALTEEEAGFEVQPLSVGFVDLVGSTELGEQLTMRDLGALLSSFETRAAETVVAHGGRVIKLLGDEILFTAAEAGAACAIALDLRDAFRDDELVPPIRAGVAAGRVMLRDGDVFGSVVNLAARIVKMADVNEVLTTTEVARLANRASEPVGRHELKGIAGEVELCRLVRD